MCAVSEKGPWPGLIARLLSTEGLRDLTPGPEDHRNPGPNQSVGFSADGSEIWINGTSRSRLTKMPLLGGAAHAFLSDAAYAAGIRYCDAARSAADVTVGSKWGYTYTADWHPPGGPRMSPGYCLCPPRTGTRRPRFIVS